LKDQKVDRRIRYTKSVLRQSLLELLKTRPVSQITVKELCEYADINRGTFYSHYSNPQDLLSQIENEFIDNISRLLKKNPSAKPLRRNFSNFDVALEIFEYIKDNSDICMIILGEHGDAEFIKNAMLIAKDRCFNEWESFVGPGGAAVHGYLYDFIASGSAAMIQRWVFGGVKESPKEMAEILYKFVNSGLSGFAPE